MHVYFHPLTHGQAIYCAHRGHHATAQGYIQNLGVEWGAGDRKLLNGKRLHFYGSCKKRET